LDSLVQVGGINQVEASQKLFRLGERAISDGYLSVADAHDSSGAGRLKSF
jgi:hypothetical protein